MVAARVTAERMVGQPGSEGASAGPGVVAGSSLMRKSEVEATTFGVERICDRPGAASISGQGSTNGGVAE